jgi:phage shock protein PspC (stress-responsive transcriptional regulator)
MADRLYRSRSDRMAAGVAGGLAERFDADPSVIRVLWVIVSILSGGLAIIVYVAMAFIVPDADDEAGPVDEGGATGEGAPGMAGVPSTTSTTPTGPGWVAPAPRPPRPARQGDGGRRAAIVVGLVLVLVGAFLLIRQFAPAVDLSLAWPIASVVLGVALVILSVRPKRPA